MREKMKRFIPDYALLPLVLVAATNFLVYGGARVLTAGRVHYDLTTWPDTKIPFLPVFVIPYVLAYVQWIAGFIMIGRESRDLCDTMLSGELIAKLISGLCFLILPTTILRPEITGSGICDRLTGLIYAVDAADNLFPSIHCLESWVVLRGALKIRKAPGWYMPLMLVSTLLVFASTVCLKQHVFVDIIGGIAVAEIGFAVSNRFGGRRIFERLRNLNNN